MKLRTPRSVTTCGRIFALTLMGIPLASCNSDRAPEAGPSFRQSPAVDRKRLEPVHSPASEEKSGVAVSAPSSAKESGETASLIPGFAFARKNGLGYSEYLHESTGIIFVKLPGGKFMMGGTEKEEREVLVSVPPEHRNDVKELLAVERPRHEVMLSSFLIAKHEVTQAQWKLVMGTSPSHFKGDALPVESVSWDSCQEFCRKTGLSLPTEAQWEFACRAGTTTSFGFGDAAEDLGEYAWFYLNSGHAELPVGTEWDDRKVLGKWGCRTHPVGARRPNDFGLHDMHGNVWEWCEDMYDARYYSKAASGNGDSACTSGSRARVTRGGGWNSDARVCRSAGRDGSHPDYRDRYLGLRPVKSRVSQTSLQRPAVGAAL